MTTNIKYITDKVNEVYQICETNDPYRIAEIEDITVISAELPNPELKGATLPGDGKYIFLNENLKGTEQEAFVLAHELGHFFMHRGQLGTIQMLNLGNFTGATKDEAEANIFAFKLMLYNQDISHLNKYDFVRSFDLDDSYARYIV